MMSKILILTLLYFNVLGQIKSENFVNKVLRRIKKPKLWYEYTEEILNQIFKQKPLYHLQFTSYQLFKEMSYFMKYSERLLTKPEYNVIVKKASGRLELEDVGVFVLFVRKTAVHESFPHIYLPHVSYTWEFEVDNLLRVQFIFKSIYFKSSQYDCLKGNITLHQNTLGYSSNLRRDFFNKFIWSYPRFHFCGQMAMFVLYPSSNKIFIKLSVMEDMFYKVNMSFMVIDKNIMETKRGVFNLSETLYSSVLIKRSTMIISYHLQVHKTQRIALKILRSVVLLIFNGPGFLSKMLKAVVFKFDNQHKYAMTTTFQCMIQVLSYNVKYNTIAYFNFTSRNTKIHKLHIFSYKLNILHIPSILCSKMSCTFHILGPTAYHINITHLYQSYKGVKTMDCIYGGISFIEQSGHEIKTICESHNTSVSQSRSIFSSTAELISVAYSYEHYSKLVTTMHFELTKCQPVQIDICKFNSRCHSNDKQLCIDYIGPIFNKSHIEYIYNDSKAKLYYSLRLNQCVVFQFVQELTFDTLYEKYITLRYLSHCKLELQASSISTAGYIMRYKFKGSSMHNRSDEKWSISFKGFNDEFCYQLGAGSKYECMYKICKNIDCYHFLMPWKVVPFYEISGNMSENTFRMWAHTTSPTFDTSFRFEINFARWTHSWMDMVVWKEKSSDISGFMYLQEKIPIRESDFRLLYVTGNPRDILRFSLISVNRTENTNLTVVLNIYSLINRKPWKYYSGLELQWKNYFVLSGAFNSKSVSVPGSIFEVSISVDEKHNLISTDSLQAQWINDRYSRYTNFTPQVENGDNYCDLTFSDGKWCNYSSYQKQGFFINKYYYLFESETVGFTARGWSKRQHSHSWSYMEAEELCMGIGGHLPYFLDREELEELIDFLRNSPHILPYEAFYIGMNLKDEHKVILFLVFFTMCDNFLMLFSGKFEEILI